MANNTDNWKKKTKYRDVTDGRFTWSY